MSRFYFLFLIILLVGCKAEHAEETNLSSQIPPITDDTEMLKLVSQYNSGRDQFSGSCASCHGSVDNTDKRNRSPENIQNAIFSIGTMKFLKGLSADVTYEISLALDDQVKSQVEEYLRSKDPTPPPPPEENFRLAEIKPIIGTRFYLESTFEDLFVAPAAQRTTGDTQILNKIKTLIVNQGAALGGPCRLYDSSCPGSLDDNREAEALPAANALRKGYTIRACEEILAINQSVNNALAKVQLTVTSQASQQNIAKVFDLFFPGKDFTQNELNSIARIHQSCKNKGMNDINSWRFSLLGLCKSSLLEVL
ncbi:MAG: hypothetical protein KDD61_07750 [Bdellovibrionales bacterium]|nr:hypothetical protein [Bdellovibrionales bacterium]